MVTNNELMELSSWLDAYELGRERRRRTTQEADEPFASYAETLLARIATTSERLAPLYEKAEQEREKAKTAFILRISNEIEKSVVIPQFMKTPVLYAKLTALNANVKTIADEFLRGSNIFLAGSVGTGKTQTAVVCMYLWMQKYTKIGFHTSLQEEALKGIRPQPRIENFYQMSGDGQHVYAYPLFVTTRHFLHELRSVFSGNGDDSLIMRKYLSASVLTVDDIGAEKVTDWTRERLITLLELRLYDRAKQTILTSNYAVSSVQGKSALSNILDDRIVSRIVETCQCYEFTGADLRLGKRGVA